MKLVAVRLGEGWRKHADAAWADGWHPEPFELDGGITHVVTMGAGPTVVLLPPLPGYKEAWVACAPRLAADFRLVTFDLRARYADGPRWDVLVRDLERVLATHAPGPAVVIGHSLGGALAQHWALAHPERVRGLVLSSSFARVTTPRQDLWQRFVEQPLVLAGQRWLPRGIALRIARDVAARGGWVYDAACDERVLDFVRFCIRDVPLGVARGAVRLAFSHDTRADLPRLRCPTLILVGERETRFALEATDELARLIPGAETRVSPGVAHLHPLSGATWMAATLRAWLLDHSLD